MAGARGDALEWALALAEAPGERHALRRRPLPEGMELLLQVAGGHEGPVLEAAMQRTGRAAAELVEAARFYLREVLFFPEADAYRVLGLAVGAGDEQVKHHHRLLQLWLHPDRPASDWDAAFAARVNAAWSQLRTRERRQAYALQRAAAAAPAATPEPVWVPARVPAAPLAPTDAADPGRWRRRAPVLALFAVCAILGVLVVRDLQREPDTGFAEARVDEAAADAPQIALELPDANHPAGAGAAPARPKAGAKADRPGAARPPAPSPNPLKRAIAALPTPAGPAPIPPPARKPVVDVAARTATVAAPVAQAAATPGPAPQARTAPSVSRVGPEPAAIRAASLEVPPSRQPAPPLAAPRGVEPVALARAPAPGQATAAAAPLPKPAVAVPPPASAASTQQAVLAEQTGRRLLAYVAGGRGGVPPIWANLAAQAQASQARESLQGGGRISVAAPEWRIGDDTASLRTRLAARDGASRSLRAELVWRDQRWLVRSLELGS